MIWKQIRGHATQVEMFRRSIRRGRLSHAYLFVGDEGIGKRTFARALSQCLLCDKCDDADLEACGTCSQCRQMQAGSHPDFLSIGCPEGKSVLPIDLIAGSPECRGREGLCFDLSLRPASATRRIAVIDDADRMNAESANALLKTLEEPPSYSVLILIAANPDSLLPTIRSRCQQVRFAPLTDSDVAELLRETGIVDDAAEAAIVARLSGGSVATAAQLVDPALRKLREELYERLSSRRFDSVSAAQRVLNGLEELSGETSVQRNAAEWLMRFIVDLFRQTLRHLAIDDNESQESTHVSNLATLFSSSSADDLEVLMSAIDRTSEALEQLHRSAPPALCIEGLMDDLGRILRSAHVPGAATPA